MMMMLMRVLMLMFMVPAVPSPDTSHNPYVPSKTAARRGGFGGRQRLGMPRRVLRDRVAVLALLLQAERLPG